MAEMPRELHAAPVSNGARNTLSLLWSYATPGRPIAWPSVPRMATETAQDQRTIRKHLAELRTGGLIRKQQRGSHSVWELLRPGSQEKRGGEKIAVIDAMGGAPTGRPGENARNERAADPAPTGRPPEREGTQAYQLANQEKRARARGSGDGLRPAAPRSRKSRTEDRGDPSPPETRATDAQVVDLCSAIASEVQDPALRALVESKGRGAVASLPELLARVRKPPAKKAPGVACARTIARGTG